MGAQPRQLPVVLAPQFVERIAGRCIPDAKRVSSHKPNYSRATSRRQLWDTLIELQKLISESSVQDTNWTEPAIRGGEEYRAADRAGVCFLFHWPRFCAGLFRSLYGIRFHGFSRPLARLAHSSSPQS
jgi:hypothetical protein